MQNPEKEALFRELPCEQEALTSGGTPKLIPVIVAGKKLAPHAIAFGKAFAGQMRFQGAPMVAYLQQAWNNLTRR